VTVALVDKVPATGPISMCRTRGLADSELSSCREAQYQIAWYQGCLKRHLRKAASFRGDVQARKAVASGQRFENKVSGHRNESRGDAVCCWAFLCEDQKLGYHQQRVDDLSSFGWKYYRAACDWAVSAANYLICKVLVG
jgi:hypothetical protein